MIRRFAVITTIQQPTSAVRKLVSGLFPFGATLIVVGDKKGPQTYEIENSHFLSLSDQLAGEFSLARVLPTGHYARKNLGYLFAISNAASSIYETDDDNAPIDGWEPREEIVRATEVDQPGWVNVYRLFCDENIWPRGFPLDSLHRAVRARTSEVEEFVRAPIQQGLVNNCPDVDAIWRLTLDRPFDFQLRASVHLRREAWCPFNSQSTWWFPIAYPLMYLPSYCSFRMTDIWRSFIAQRCLWELDLGIVFHGPEATQERNQHDLMRDFVDEIPGYTRNQELVTVLKNLRLEKGSDALLSNLLSCYEVLIGKQFFPKSELDLVRTWIADLEEAQKTRLNATAC